MKRYFSLTLFTLGLMLALTQGINGQDFSKNSLKVGFGGGLSSSSTFDGTGLTYCVGFQREIWKNRLRINPNLNFGSYDSRFLLDAGDMDFKEFSLETVLSYDLVRLGYFSIVINGGLIGGFSHGLISSAGMPDLDMVSPQPFVPYSVTDFQAGFSFGGGLRINNPNKRIAVNLLPFNFHIGYPGYTGAHLKLEVDIKL